MRTIFMLMALLSITATAATADEVALPIDPNANVETICEYGYSKRVRPPYSVTNAIKVRKLREIGLTEGDRSRFELDHRVPLCLGGTSDWENFRLQPWRAAEIKDEAERQLCRDVCAGTTTLREAQESM
jgi:hypothetical protein